MPSRAGGAPSRRCHSEIAALDWTSKRAMPHIRMPSCCSVSSFESSAATAQPCAGSRLPAALAL
eukprot:1091282-Prymnesium_polylepis.1